MHRAQRLQHAARGGGVGARDVGQITFSHFVRCIAQGAGLCTQRTHHAASDCQAAHQGQHHGDQGKPDQYVAMGLKICLRIGNDLLGGGVHHGLVAMDVSDQGCKQRAAFIVDLGDRLVPLVTQRQVHDAQGHGAIGLLRLFDGLELRFLVGRHIWFAQRRPEFGQPRLHVFMGLRYRQFLHIALGGLGRQHQIARGDRPAVYRSLTPPHQLGANTDARDEVVELLLLVAQVFEGQTRYEHDQQHHQAEGKAQFCLHGHGLEVHLAND